MIVNTRHIIPSLAFCWLLSGIYTTEMVRFWTYMGLTGEFSLSAFVFSTVSTIGLAAIVPKTGDTREYIVTFLNYMFFLPAIVFVYYSNTNLMHFAGLVISILAVYFLSGVKSPLFALKPLPQSQILILVFSLIVLSIVIQAMFGGLAYFNLDIERVYEFRASAASQLPPVFGYVYSNVSSVLMPIALTLALKYKNNYLVALTIFCSVMLFGMTHHKSVLFGPFAVAILYMFLQRAKSPDIIGWMFAGLIAACLTEVFVMRQLLGSGDPAYVTSLIVRRVLLVPSMLDGRYTDLFDILPKYYWSTSRLGEWLSENPHGIAAPFLIGEEYFGDVTMSANAGMIGSGFSNAGLVGVAIYAVVVGLLISILNAYGSRIGHAFVSAASLATVFNVVTSTDLVTALLTHGLLLLLLVLSLFPPEPTPAPEQSIQ